MSGGEGGRERRKKGERKNKGERRGKERRARERYGERGIERREGGGEDREVWREGEGS